MTDVVSIDIATLDKLLRQPGYSQRGLAKALGCSGAAVSNMLNGGRPPRQREIPVIHRYLGLAEPTLARVSPHVDTDRGAKRRLGIAIRALHRIVDDLDGIPHVARRCTAGRTATAASARARRTLARIGMIRIS